jgi:hypothetical protein
MTLTDGKCAVFFCFPIHGLCVFDVCARGSKFAQTAQSHEVSIISGSRSHAVSRVLRAHTSAQTHHLSITGDPLAEEKTLKPLNPMTFLSLVDRGQPAHRGVEGGGRKAGAERKRRHRSGSEMPKTCSSIQAPIFSCMFQYVPRMFHCDPRVKVICSIDLN